MLDPGLITQADYDAPRPRRWACKPQPRNDHVEHQHAAAGAAYTGPGSPQDVPPLPGSSPIDPATLPAPIRDELLAPDPVAIDTSADELKDGVNRCPKCGATDIRHKPGTGLLVCLFCRHEWHGAAGRGGVRLRRGPRPARGHDHRLRRARHRRRRRQPDDASSAAAAAPRSTVNTAERDDRALPLVPPRARRQRAGAQRRGARRGAAVPHQEGRRGRAHPPVRGQAPDVRAEGVQGTVHARERRRRLPAVHGRRRQRERRRRRQRRDRDPPLHAGQRRQQGDLLRRRRLPGASGTWTSPSTT